MFNFQCGDDSWFYEPVSGGVYRENRLLREILSLASGPGEEEALKTLSEQYSPETVHSHVNALRGSGVLPLERPPEDKAVAGAAGGGMEEMYLQIAHRCNMACSYCYAQGGDFGGAGALMDEAVAFRAVDFLIKESGQRSVVIVNFDGGEPFLNFPLVEAVSAYARDRGGKAGKVVRLNISTNGTLFSRENTAFLADNGVGIGVSIDGDEVAHDRNRKFKNGRGSYRLVVDTLREAGVFTLPEPVNARVTVTKGSLECLRAVVHLYGLGFRHIYLEPAAGLGSAWAVDGEDLEIIKKEFAAIADFYMEELLKGSGLILRNFYRPLERIHRRSGSGYRCSAGRSMIAVSPEGDIYPCYKFVGHDAFRMGSIWREGLDNGVAAMFREAHADRKASCAGCWARYLCGGGCTFLSEWGGGSLKQPDPLDCQFSRYMIELALRIYVGISQRDAGVWKKLFPPLSGG